MHRTHRPQELRSRWLVALDVFSVTTFFTLLVLLALEIAAHFDDDHGLVFFAVMLGYLGADFVSAVVHWLADSWGSPRLPIIGQALVKPFREHHTDPMAITRHGFLETNGNNCGISLPVLVIALSLPLDRDGPLGLLPLFAATFCGSLVFWVMCTNQFHKWSHQTEQHPVVAFLQRFHVILPPEHHALHHVAPFDRHYAITTGWLNAPLAAIRFFPLLEAVVTRVTGWVPRADDLGEDLARELVAAEAPGTEPEQG